MPLRLNGATSGYVQLAAPNAAGSTSLVLPTDSVQPGLVLVATSSFTTAATVSVDGCFTGAYDNYRVIVTYTGSADANLQGRLRLSGTDASGASDYVYQFIEGNNTTVSGGRSTTSSALVAAGGTGTLNALALDVTRPAVAAPTGFLSALLNGNSAGLRLDVIGNTHALSTAYDGFTIYPASGTITGSLAVYGYRASITT